MYDYLMTWMRISFAHAFTIKRRRKKSTVGMIPSTTPVLLLLLCSMVMEIRGECFGGVETYEKTAGMGFATSTNLQGLVSQPGTAVTRDCAALCRQTATCAAFAVDYATSRCQSIDADSIKNRDHLKDTSGVNYFEKICLRRISQFNALCGDRQWAFERVIGATLQGFDELEQANVQSRADCQRLCLEQTAFVCRSAEYDEKAQLCRLSREDRRTQPQSFRKDGGSWDYMENQCVRTLPDCRYAARTDGSLAVSMDQVEFAQSQGECESLCDQARVFTCRAYSFTADENRCYLSGDDSISHQSGSAIQFENSPSSSGGKKSTVYAEKICSVSQCENGIFTFEKVTGHFLRTARQEMLSRGRLPPVNKILSANDSMSGGITVDCGRTCLEMGADCPAYSVDYLQGRCFKLDRNTQGRAQELTIREGMSYFEKICLRGNVGPCRDRAWAFERHPGKELRGMDERTLPLVATRRDCQEACLKETRFVCRSARYDTKTLDCKLSPNDKRLRPDAFMNADSQTVEYLENQCAGLGTTTCTYQTVPDMYARYMDSLVSNIADDEQCQQLCSTNRPFSCRSYSFYASGSQCFISSDDRVSGGSSALQSRPGTNYTERNCSVRQSFVRNDTFSPSSSSSTGGSGGGIFNSFGVVDSGTILEIKPAGGSSSGRFPSINSGSGISSGGGNSFERTPGIKNTDSLGGTGSLGNKCRSGRTVHFQKVAGYEAVTSRFMSLRPASSTITSRTGILVDCLDKCATEMLCGGINYGTAKQNCVGVEIGGSSSGDELMSSGNRLPLSFGSRLVNESETPLLRPTSAVGYFESLCLQVPACDSAWSTERTPGYFMRGVEREIVRSVSRLQCTERCLDERRFACRSASYDTNRRECHLSTEDRYSRPRAFQSNPIFDYIENQCSSLSSSTLESQQCRYGPVRPDRYLLYADRMVSGVNQAAGCQAACDSERNFRCRSYSLHEQSSSTSSSSSVMSMVCSLSSSTSMALEFQRGALSADKTDCLSASTNLNEIPPAGLLETAPLGASGGGGGGFINTRDQPRILSGSIGGSVAGSDPGGWVSLAALSRTQVSSGKSPNSYYPGNNFNPLLPRPDIIRRPLDVTIYDSGFQYNTVGVSSRPFNPTADVPVFVDNNISRCRGVLSYDKVANVDFVGARRQEIRLSSEGNPTLECLRECDRLRERCLSVVMSTDRFIPETKFVQNVTGSPRLRCYILDRSAAIDSAPLPYTLNSMYYEKTCLPEAGCGKLWTFVRVHGYELEGVESQVTRSMASKEECQAACLRSPNCRSAEFMPRDRVCRMSPDNRRTQLRNFRAAAPDTIYMENQCAPDPPQCEYSDQIGRVSPWYDRIVTLSPDIGVIQGLSDCRQLCDSERDFLCKSVSVQLRRNPVCMLSSDDSISLNGANGVNSLMPDREFTYSERSNCGNVRVECTKTDMVITLAFGYPFNGRVYVNGNYQSCFEMGNGQNQMVMRIPLVGSCGTVQQIRNRYVNNIVVQHNPLIMQDTDSNVRVECAFEASEQTISYSPGGRRDGSDMGFGSIDVTSPVRQVGYQSVVTNTAPTPALRMRILSQNGQESRIVGLGEQLTLRIEIDPSSAFGITARNVEARTDNGEILTLIDATGCPRDANIFPPMDMDRNSKSLTADFKAFRFPTTATVNFVATVGFCQERCEPSRCADGWESYGRRRREVNASEAIASTQSSEEVIHLTSISTTLSPISAEVSAEAREETEVDTGGTESSSIVKEPHTPMPSTTAGHEEVNHSRPTSIVPIPDNNEEELTVQEDSNLLPYEVPLHLQLIVTEEVERKPVVPVALPSPLPSTAKSPDFYEPLPTREQPYWRSPYLIQSQKPTVEQDVCSSQSTVVAVSVVAVLMNLALAIGFWFFYRSKRASWRKLAISDHRSRTTEQVYGLRPSGSVSEVTFRSVYGQKSGPGTLTRAFNLNNLNTNPRGPHIASVFSPNP